MGIQRRCNMYPWFTWSMLFSSSPSDSHRCYICIGFYVFFFLSLLNFQYMLIKIDHNHNLRWKFKLQPWGQAYIWELKSLILKFKMPLAQLPALYFQRHVINDECIFTCAYRIPYHVLWHFFVGSYMNFLFHHWLSWWAEP